MSRMARKRKLEASPTADRAEMRRLLGAAKADHWEDGPRLALADWLEENGGEADRARAEVIRLQIDADNGGPPWRGVVERLRDKHVREWMPTNRDIFSRLLPTCERGLLVAGGSPAAWGDSTPDEAWEWVETARPSSIKVRDLPALMAAPRLTSLACLDLDTRHRGAAALGRLLDAPFVPRRIVIGCNPDLVASVVARKLRPGLEGLRLRAGVYFGSRRPDWGALLRCDGASGLRELELIGTGPNEAEAPLAAGLPLRRLHVEEGLFAASLPALAGPHLRHLELCRVGFPPETLARLEGSACRDTLEGLVLYTCLAGPAAPFRLPRLRRLTLRNCSLDAARTASLAEGGTFNGLTRLDLWGNPDIGEAGIAALAASCPEGPRLLRLRGSLTDAGLRRLAAWRGLAGVRMLDVAQNDLTDAGLRALAESPHAIGLEGLDLEYNRRLTADGVMALLRSPLGARLTWLSVAGTCGSPRDVRFEDAPPPRLRELELGWMSRRTSPTTERLAAIRAALPGCAVGH
jgi:uncharacterized protein (TIGR02996 family)